MKCTLISVHLMIVTNAHTCVYAEPLGRYRTFMGKDLDSVISFHQLS